MDCSTVQHLHWKIQVELGGGLFRGVQRGDPSLKLEPLILFDDSSIPVQRRSTMCLKPADLSADAVRTAIRKQQELYGTFQTYTEKACGRILSQFASKQRKPKNLAVAA